MSNNMELYVIILLLSSSDHCMLSHYKVTFCVEATPSSTQSRSRFADKQFRTYCTFSSTTLSTVCIKVPLQYITFKLQAKHVIVKYMIHVWFFVFLLSALSMFIYSHRVTTLKLTTSNQSVCLLHKDQPQPNVISIISNNEHGYTISQPPYHTLSGIDTSNCSSNNVVVFLEHRSRRE